MKKILIISSNRLGDCILSSGLNNFFKKKFSQVKIYFVCGLVPAEFFKYCKNIDKLIILKKQKLSLHWFFLWRLIFFNFWDCVIDLRGSGISYFLITRKRKIYRSKSGIHKVKDISSLVSEKILSPNINFNQVKLSSKNQLKKITKLAKKKKIIILAPTSNWIGKNWPAENFLSLIRKLKNKKIFSNSLFVIVAPEFEKDSILKLLNDRDLPIFNLVGKSCLAEIFLIMKKSKLFIGNDSGLMHLSALANIPTVGLFGPSDPSKYHPWGDKTHTIKSPKNFKELMSFKNFNHKKVNSLMYDLTVDFVFDEVVKFYDVCNE